jgi:predicted component of type VI protein secretion system
MYRGMQGQCAAKLEPRPIDEALSGLEGIINELNQTISAFEQRLNPYLVPESPSDTKGKDLSVSTRATVTTKIHAARYEISMIISYIHRLIGRID